jgi:sugar/nucleoside kinase (ribokinase family)
MIPGEPDLLVIGGLTVDRLDGGSSAPGGSVLHIARALAPRRVRLAALTVAGTEPMAQAGLAELRRLAVSVDCGVALSTATFVHHETNAGRRLELTHSGGQIALSSAQPRARAVLLAPVADELADADLTHLTADGTRGAILQGWLREVDRDGQVLSRSLRSIGSSLLASLAAFDLLVASREDLAADGPAPDDQLNALRRTLGQGPALVLTAGSDGAWIDVAGEWAHLPVPQPVEGAATVGAGDVFAGLLLAAAWQRPATAASFQSRVELAMREVADLLAGRQTRT